MGFSLLLRCSSENNLFNVQLQTLGAAPNRSTRMQNGYTTTSERVSAQTQHFVMQHPQFRPSSFSFHINIITASISDLFHALVWSLATWFVDYNRRSKLAVAHTLLLSRQLLWSRKNMFNLKWRSSLPFQSNNEEQPDREKARATTTRSTFSSGAPP